MSFRCVLKRVSACRLDQAILDELRRQGTPLSRARLKKLFAEGGVSVLNRPRGPSYLLVPGEHDVLIRAGLPIPDQHAMPAPNGCILTIIYEDGDLLVLHKRAGVPTLPHEPGETATAVSAALAHFPGLAGIGRGGLEPGLLHRLDTGTSGLLVFAKTPEAFAWFRQEWREGRVRKFYRAWVSPLDAEEGRELLVPRTLKFVLGHDPDSAKRMMVVSPASRVQIRGKPIPTITELRETHGKGARGRDLEIEIRTGAMHQIRASLRFLGWPVVGDPIYRGNESPRLWLHAWRLRLPLPGGGKELWLEAQLPEGWVDEVTH